MRKSGALTTRFIKMVEDLSFTNKAYRIAMILGATEHRVKKALEVLNDEKRLQGMNKDVRGFYIEGARAAKCGKSTDACEYNYDVNIKAYCAWMGGYNDHKTTRKQS